MDSLEKESSPSALVKSRLNVWSAVAQNTAIPGDVVPVNIVRNITNCCFRFVEFDDSEMPVVTRSQSNKEDSMEQSFLQRFGGIFAGSPVNGDGEDSTENRSGKKDLLLQVRSRLCPSVTLPQQPFLTLKRK